MPAKTFNQFFPSQRPRAEPASGDLTCTFRLSSTSEEVAGAMRLTER